MPEVQLQIQCTGEGLVWKKYWSIKKQVSFPGDLDPKWAIREKYPVDKYTNESNAIIFSIFSVQMTYDDPLEFNQPHSFLTMISKSAG